jgi:hypothetical protein
MDEMDDAGDEISWEQRSQQQSTPPAVDIPVPNGPPSEDEDEDMTL